MSENRMVIVNGGEGYAVCEGTFEVAKQIFDSYISNLDREVIAIAKSFEEDSKVQYVSLKSLAQSLYEVYNLDTGAVAEKYSRFVLGIKEKDKAVTISDEMKTELAVWMMKHKLGDRDLSSASVSTFERADVWSLKMLAPILSAIKEQGKEIKFCDYDEYFECARKYRVIMNDRWKEGATEKAKINYVLSFVNDNLVNSRYDDGFELCEVKPRW